MIDTSKFDIFMNEIVSLEKMIHKFVNENQELENKKSTLESKVESLEKENEVLLNKINLLEKKINNAEEYSSSAKIKTKLDLSERENLKDQIDDLIARIDYHIGS